MAPTRAHPGRPRNEAIDEAVISQAQRMLAEVGYEALSMAAVAVAAGTTRQALYRRYPSKADLATAAVAAMSDMDSRPDSDSPFADLVAELRAFRDGVSRPNGIALVGTMLQCADDELVRLFRQRLVEPRRRRLRHILDRAALAGLIDSSAADRELATSLVTGSLYALALAGIKPSRDWAQRTAQLAWRGLGGA